jgi:uncharacterized protein YyaL (SSP411 family)
MKARAQRIAPGRDDKLLVSWNGLMIDAMARGFQVLEDERYLGAAQQAAQFILDHMWLAPGTADAESGDPHHPQFTAKRLLHSYKDGRARFNAYLDDYAALIDALVSLYESTFEIRWLVAALELADTMVSQYWDESGGSFFFTPQDHEALITRVRDLHDSATPSGNSLAVHALLRLGSLTGRTDLMSKAERTVQSFSGVMGQSPRAAGQMLIAVDFMRNRPVQVVISPASADSETCEMLRAIRRSFMPSKVVARGAAEAEVTRVLPLAVDKPSLEGRTTVYICENYACQAPVTGVNALQGALQSLVRSGLN